MNNKMKVVWFLFCTVYKHAPQTLGNQKEDSKLLDNKAENFVMQTNRGNECLQTDDQKLVSTSLIYYKGNKKAQLDGVLWVEITSLNKHMYTKCKGEKQDHKMAQISRQYKYYLDTAKQNDTAKELCPRRDGEAVLWNNKHEDSDGKTVSIRKVNKMNYKSNPNTGNMEPKVMECNNIPKSGTNKHEGSSGNKVKTATARGRITSKQMGRRKSRLETTWRPWTT
jgi:hypothetical protein